MSLRENCLLLATLCIDRSIGCATLNNCPLEKENKDMNKPVIAIAMGYPAGIGPELIIKVLTIDRSVYHDTNIDKLSAIWYNSP